MCATVIAIKIFQASNQSIYINDVMRLLLFVGWMVNESPEGVSCKVSDCGGVGSGVPNIDFDVNVVKSMYALEMIFSSIRGGTGGSDDVVD